jgi:hypothetical protein
MEIFRNLVRVAYILVLNINHCLKIFISLVFIVIHTYVLTLKIPNIKNRKGKTVSAILEYLQNMS